MQRTLLVVLLSLGLVGVAAATHGNNGKGDDNGNGYGKKGGSSPTATVPEINSGAAAMALGLLFGGVLVLRGRRKPERE